MVKILMGLAAAVVIAVGGFFGFEFYTQHRIAREVDAAFEQMRAGGGKASHGKVSFDLRSRTLRIDDIATKSATQPPLSVKIASVTASGWASPTRRAFRLTAIEASDLEIGANIAGPADGKLSYKVPRGGEGLFRPREHAAARFEIHHRRLSFRIGAIRGCLRDIGLGPTLLGRSTSARLRRVIRLFGHGAAGIKDGKIAAMQVERNFHRQHPTGRQNRQNERRNGQFRLARFRCRRCRRHPGPAKGERRPILPRLRQTTAGPYTITSAQGLRMNIDGMTLDDVSARPSRLQLPALFALMPAAGTTPTPAQTREMIDKMAALYEGMRIGTAEMRGLSAETPQGPFKLAGDQVQPGRRQDRRVCVRSARRALSEGALQARTLRAQVARYRQFHADLGAVRQPGATAPPNCRGAVSADQGYRGQGRHRPLQEHRQVRQHR